MAIIVRLDVMLAERKVKSKDLAEFVGITEADLSLLKQGKVKCVRFETLQRICEYLDCQPGDLLVWRPDQRQGIVTDQGPGPRYAGCFTTRK